MHFTDILDYAEAQLARARLHRDRKAEQAREAEGIKVEIERGLDALTAEINEHFRKWP